MDFPKGTRTENNPKFMKIFVLYKSMMARCYNPKNSSYHRYGGRGVTVREDWKTLNGFIDSIDKVEGFDLEKLVQGELQLDKDIKIKGNKEYSVDNCKFVTPQENCEAKSNVLTFIAVDPDYNYFKVRNLDKFSREYGLSAWTIQAILKRGRGSYHKWQFFNEDNFTPEKIKVRKLHKAISPDGKEYTYEKHSEFAKEHGLSAPNISMVLSGKNKHHKGWTFHLHS